MTKYIKNIIFDFGGVLLDIDYDKTYDALTSLLGFSFIPEKLPPKIIKVLHDYETGTMNTESFIWNLQQLAKGNVPQGRAIMDAWNAMLLGWDPVKFDFLLDLRKKYNLFLLSNTNELHLDWVYRDLSLNHKINNFDSCFFNKTYYSHNIHLKKPDEAVYRFVTQDANIIPGETCFIDDIKANIEGAKKMGWNTYLHHPQDNLIDIFKFKLKLI